MQGFQIQFTLIWFFFLELSCTSFLLASVSWWYLADIWLLYIFIFQLTKQTAWVPLHLHMHPQRRKGWLFLTQSNWWRIQVYKRRVGQMLSTSGTTKRANKISSKERGFWIGQFRFMSAILFVFACLFFFLRFRV